MTGGKQRSFTEVEWQTPFKVNLIDQKLEKYYEKPGTYIISMRDRPIHRVGGIDENGILYIGSSLKIGSRLNLFWNADHPASGLLWVHQDLAQLIFQKQIKTRSEVEKLIANLEIRVAIPIKRNQLKDAERATLLAYMMRFGELPPLNFNIPGGRWEKPDQKEIAWGERGVSYA
jgi:hypothetical protein